MRYWFWWLAFFLSSAHFDVIAQSAPLTAAQWLQAMEHALKTSTFQGTLVYAGTNRVDTLKVFHSVLNGVEQEHIISLDEPVREVIRDRSRIFCFIQEQRSGRVSAIMSTKSWLGLPSALKHTSRHYSLQLGKQQAVMERPTQIVTIQPKDSLRYQRKLWIDQASLIPIKTQIIDNSGRVLEQLIFAKLSTNEPIPHSQFQLPDDSKSYQWAIQKTESIPEHQQRWQLVDKPVGFNVVKYMRQQNKADSSQVTHILLSDGVSLISVYVDSQTEIVESQLETYTIGAINLVTSVRNGYRLTVLGEVPEQTIQPILDGIKLIQ